jgi:hypothetical protein
MILNAAIDPWCQPRVNSSFGPSKSPFKPPVPRLGACPGHPDRLPLTFLPARRSIGLISPALLIALNLSVRPAFHSLTIISPLAASHHSFHLPLTCHFRLSDLKSRPTLRIGSDFGPAARHLITALARFAGFIALKAVISLRLRLVGHHLHRPREIDARPV